MMNKQKFKEKLNKLAKLALASSILATSVTGAYLMATYEKFIKTDTEKSSGLIVGVEGGDVSYARYLDQEGKLSLAVIPIVPFGLETKIHQSLSKKQPIKAVIETHIKVYRANWGKGKERYDITSYIDSLEEGK
jgi:hypothetical protein